MPLHPLARMSLVLSLPLAATPALAQTTYSEIESPTQINTITGMDSGDSLVGFVTSQLTDNQGPDAFLIGTLSRPPAVYVHRFTLTTAQGTGKLSLRGRSQTFTPGVGGSVWASTYAWLQADAVVPVESQWYGFGRAEQVLGFIESDTSGPTAYTATLSSSAVAITPILPLLEAGQITISTMGQTTVDTTIHVYDGNFTALPGYSNDDETFTSTTQQSYLRRNYAPGTYYVAVGRSNTAWEIPAPGDDHITPQNLGLRGLSYGPDTLVSSMGSDSPLDLDFRILAGNGILFQSAQLPASHPTDVLWFQFTVGVGAPTLNDDCAHAGVLAPGESCAGTFLQAQSNGTSSCDPGGSSSRDCWFRYTNTTGRDVAFRVDTCGSASDTTLAILASCAGPELACNDDSLSPACGPQTSRASRLVPSGQTVFVRVGDKGLAGTIFVLNVTAVPSNDECATPKVLAGGGVYPLDDGFASTSAAGQTEAACNLFGNPGIGRDLWYTYTAAVGGPVQITTCGLIGPPPGDDTKIAVYAGAGCPTPGSVIACSELSVPTCAGGTQLNATVNFNATCGMPYTIQIGISPFATAPVLGSFQILEQGPALGAWCFTPYTKYCTGDVAGTTCTGCGNNGVKGRGCGNSVYSGGADLSVAGIASVTAAFDTLRLKATDVTGACLFMQANNPAAAGPIPYGDGLLCAAVGIIRMGVVFPAGGVAQFPGGPAPVPIHTAGAPLAAGATKHYQGWYRDAATYCTSTTSNFTPAVSLVWYP